jgi:uncharacterized membrane protein YraQ (UPF0718 family)
MQESSLSNALAEFVHVGGALVGIIAIVSLLTGVMREYIPQDKIQKKLAKHERYGSLMGAAFGTLTPFCSASVVPVSMGMAEMGVSIGTIFGFLISAPLCNFVVFGLILAVFGLKVAVVFFVLTFSSAVLSGYLIERSPWRHEVKRGAELLTGTKAAATCSATPSPCGATGPVNACGASASATQGASGTAQKMRSAMRFAWLLFKRIVPYVLVGAVISALSAAYLPSEMVEKYVGGDNWYSIPLAAAIGVPLYLRIEMAIPLLKVLIAKGMGMGAAMALIVGGTGASLPEIALISAVLKPKAVIAFVLTVMTTAVISGFVFNAIA